MQRFSGTLLNLTVTDGRVHTTDGHPFDREGYSHFKYGWLPPALDYAREMSAMIADQLWHVSDGRPVRIVSAPYKYLPTASHAIAQYMCRDLSIRAIEVGHEPPVLLPFFKSKTGNSSYAQGSYEHRKQVLAKLGLHIDATRVTGSTLLVVDDIRITGSAQVATSRYLEPLEPHAIWYLHAARLDRDVAKTNPGLEDELNQSVDHSPQVILQQYLAGEFQLNTRVLRHLLELPPGSFTSFVLEAPESLLGDMQQAVIGNGLAYCKQHEASLHLLNDELVRRDYPFARSAQLVSQ